MVQSKFIDGERIRKVHSVRQVEPIFRLLATSLAQVPELRYSFWQRMAQDYPRLVVF
jgi:hypothetical protein